MKQDKKIKYRITLVLGELEYYALETYRIASIQSRGRIMTKQDMLREAVEPYIKIGDHIAKEEISIK